MSNGKDIRKAQKAIKAGKPFVDPYKQDVLYTNMGQWMYPGQVTKIPSNQITMEGVNYPVKGIDDTGYSQMMYPGMNYTFPGQYVTEYPMSRYGGLPRAQSGLIQMQDKINKALGEPMKKAQDAAINKKWFNKETKKWEVEDDTDNFRHPMAGRYTAEAIANKFPDWMKYFGIPQVTGFVGSTALGIGHELAENKYTSNDPKNYPNYTFWDVISEAGEDSFNNMVGAGVGVLPISDDKKTSFLRYLSDNNKIPDGYANKKHNMYLKRNGGLLDTYQVGGKTLEDNDSWFENILEIADLTGISSWDDIYRAYKNKGIGKEVALELLGAIPLLGKVSKVTKPGIHLTKYTGLDAILRNTLPKNKSLSRAANIASKVGRGTDAVQAILGAKDNSGFTSDIEHGEVPKFGGRNLFPKIELGEHGDYAYGGWLDDYQVGGLKSVTGPAPKFDAKTEAESKRIASGYNNANKQNAQISQTRNWSQADQDHSNMVKARINNPASDLGILGANMASNITRFRNLTPEEIARVTDNPGETINLSSEMLKDGLINELVGYGASKAIPFVFKSAKAAGKYLTEETFLKNAWKLNPYSLDLAKKLANENVMIRGLGKRGLKDALNSKLLKSPNKHNPDIYWTSDFNVGNNYAGFKGEKTLATYPKSEPVFSDRYTGDLAYMNAHIQKSGYLPIDKAKFYKEHWWQRYKEVPKELPGSPNTIENIDPFLHQEPAKNSMLWGLNPMNYFGEKLPSQMYRKIGSRKGIKSLLEKKGATSPTEPSTFWSYGKKPDEGYSGVFALGYDVNHPNATAKRFSSFIGPRGRHRGVSPYDIQNKLMSNIPLEDEALNLYRRLPFSRNYKAIPKDEIATSLLANPTLAGLQNLSEKAVRAGIYGSLIQSAGNSLEGTSKNPTPLGKPLLSYITDYINNPQLNVPNKKEGGWLDNLDTYQTAGQVINRQDNTRVVIPNLPKDVFNDKNSFEKDWLSDAYEEDENVKLLKKQLAKDYQKNGLSKDQAKILAEDAYRNVEHNKSLKETIPESTFEQHVPQDLTSKTLEVLANPLLAMKQYKGHRLPDHFSSADEDFMSPVNISNLGYQFLTRPGQLAFSSQLGNEAIDNFKEGDYLQAGLNTAFALPGVKIIKDAIKYKNKLGRVANIKNIKNNKKILLDSEQKISRGIEGLGTAKDIEAAEMQKIADRGNPFVLKANGKKYELNSAQSTKNSGYTDVPQFNQEVNDLSTQMQFGKRSVPTQEQFYTTKELDKLKKQHDDYYSALNEYEKANPQNGSDMMMGFFSGNNSYMNTFHNLNPNLVNPNFGEKFIANQEYSKMLNKNFPYSPGVNNSLSPSSLKFIGSNENKLLPNAKNLLPANRSDWHLTDPRGYLMEMGQREYNGIKGIKAMSDEEVKIAANKMAAKMQQQRVDMYLKDVSTPYTGKQAFKDIQPNKYGGDLQQAQLGRFLKAGLAKTISKPAVKILKNNIIKPINKFIEPVIHEIDKVIVPIQFRKDIRKLKEKAAKQHEYFQRPEVVEKLKSLKVSPKSISNLQRPNQIDLSFEPNVGSYFDQSSGAINIDMRQIKEGAKRFGMTPSQVYEHELGHHIQQVINAGSPEQELAYNKYKAALQDYNIRQELSKRRAGISSNLDPMAVRNKPAFLAYWGMPVFPKALAKPTLLDKQAAGMLRIKAKNKKILTPEEKKILNYYHSETINDELLTKIGYNIENGTERVPHLREMRQAMLEKNYITDVSDPITEDILKKFIKENPKNRISQIMDPNIETNYKKLVKTFKHLPAVVPIGLGAAALDQEKLGGQRKLKKATSKNIQSSINDLMLRSDLMQRNQTLFGPAGKRRYKPGLKYKEGGWLDQFDK